MRNFENREELCVTTQSALNSHTTPYPLNRSSSIPKSGHIGAIFQGGGTRDWPVSQEGPTTSHPFIKPRQNFSKSLLISHLLYPSAKQGYFDALFSLTLSHLASAKLLEMHTQNAPPLYLGKTALFPHTHSSLSYSRNLGNPPLFRCTDPLSLYLGKTAVSHSHSSLGF